MIPDYAYRGDKKANLQGFCILYILRVFLHE